MRRSEKANLAPSGSPWKIEASGKRISVAANEPPKMTMKACVSDEHPQIAAHHDQRDENDGSSHEA